MALIFNKKVAGQIGLHAFIAGISAYPHLKDGTGTLAGKNFGMGQLPSTASAANSVFEWLLSNQEFLNSPLATCRLLLSPLQSETHLVGKTNECSLSKFLEEIAQWRKDSSDNPGNTTFFYFAGHGIQLIGGVSGGDAVLLMEDFGDGIGSTFAKAVRINEIYEGMKMSPSFPNMAQTQFFFVDSCRNYPPTLAGLQPLTTTPVWDYEDGGEDRRIAPLFYAAAPGTTANDLRLEPNTIFSKALLECLSGAGAQRVEVNGQPEWNISYRSLHLALGEVIKEYNKRFTTKQSHVLTHETDDGVICRLKQVPIVDFVLEIFPPQALNCTRVHFLDDNRHPVRNLNTPLTPHPFKDRVAAGIYRIEAEINPPTSPFINCPERSCLVMPPRPKITLKVIP